VRRRERRNRGISRQHHRAQNRRQSVILSGFADALDNCPRGSWFVAQKQSFFAALCAIAGQ
jgi:hypothetical protein